MKKIEDNIALLYTTFMIYGKDFFYSKEGKEILEELINKELLNFLLYKKSNNKFEKMLIKYAQQLLNKN